jgi:hypothetical protein
MKDALSPLSPLREMWCATPPNKHMQRAVTHKALGRGRSDVLLSQVLRARVLTGRRAGADVNR